ncbi:hypothetical protein LNTAR_07264 [Lentisphaera araneosa HTCC2155]|uniref:Uncharacterized protein n=1 Tax=Lentisphaera araneosa HTCC2155 TaxID=313628 RepID=A6DMY8_9BACT|nr:hypothetical protein [Lentisphaera araneosa]EDM27024.1 hypothetical protein LNTAR_07264 [Lentisphaera araneosa HTCC2155]
MELLICILLIIMMMQIGFMHSDQKKSFMLIFKAMDPDPKLFLPRNIINLVEEGQDMKALKEIKKHTGFDILESKNILMRLKAEQIKNS